MMSFVTFANTLEYFKRFLNRRFTYDDFLEAPLQSSVAFDVLAILVECSSADAL